MKNDKLTNFAIIDTNSGEITQYLTSKEKEILDNRLERRNQDEYCYR